MVTAVVSRTSIPNPISGQWRLEAGWVRGHALGVPTPPRPPDTSGSSFAYRNRPLPAVPPRPPPPGSGPGVSWPAPPAAAPPRSPAVRPRPGGVGLRPRGPAGAALGRSAAPPPRLGRLRGRRRGLHGADGAARWPGARGPAATGAAPDGFGRQRGVCQDRGASATASAAIFRGLKMAAAPRPANQRAAGGCRETRGPPLPSPSANENRPTVSSRAVCTYRHPIAGVPVYEAASQQSPRERLIE